MQNVIQYIDNFTTIIAALTQMSNFSDQNTSSAFSLLKSISSFEFVITICTCQSILPHLIPLSDHMQDPHCDMVIASSRAQTLCSLMEKKRSESDWQSTTHLAREQGIPVTKPRTTG